MINETRWYYVHLNNNVPFLELLSTLAHELVHVVQFATGRLENEENWIWEGTDYGDNPYQNDAELDSANLPWEYEAHTKEIVLAKKFVKQYYSNW